MKITSFLNTLKLNETKKENVKINSDKKESGFDSLSMEKTNENLKIYKTLKDNNVEPTKEMIEEIKIGFDKLGGTFNQKIESLDMLLKKDIEVSEKNLQIIHNSLNTRVDYNKIFDVLSKYDKEEINYDELLNKLGFSEKAISEFLINISKNMTVIENLTSIINNDFNDELTEVDKENINKIVDGNENVDDKIFELKVDEMLNEFGKTVNEVIDELKNDVPIEVIDLVNSSNFRMFLVETTTKEMNEVKNEFDNFKKENLNLIDNTLSLPDGNKNVDKKINALEKVINNFENIIMKSDITLYTTMKQEKELINMTSKLEIAKEYLEKNDFSEAKEVLKEVKKELDKIDFQPKDVKVKAFMKKEANKILFGEKNNFKDIYNTFSKKNKGVREILEVFRATGVNHDSEIAQKIEKSDFNKFQMNNLKNAVLDIMKFNEGKVSNELKNTVNNITGNQFQNKLEVKSNVQQMHFSIPYELNSKIKSLDLYVNSKKENEKMDWKNSTLYFVVNLKNYGKTGIRISSTNKVVNMNIKNDSDEFKNNSDKLFNSFLDELSEEGFIRGKVTYAKYLDENIEGNIKKDLGINKNKNGFDVRI